MDQVKIRAAIAAHGLAKNDEVTVAATPTVEGAIRNGVFVELARIPETPLTQAILDDEDNVDDAQKGADDETPVPPIEEVELPDADVESKPKGTSRRRG
jgi:hypothetical protein